jgi:hypothetical protein
MTSDLLLKLLPLVRSVALQIVARVIGHGIAYTTTFLLKYKLLDDSLASTVAAVIPGLAASILIETAFGYLQKKWNLMKIDIARKTPKTVTREAVTAEAVRELKVATGQTLSPIERRLSDNVKGQQ